MSARPSPAPIQFLAHSVLGFLLDDDRGWVFMYGERTVIVWKGQELGVSQASPRLLAAVRESLQQLGGLL